MTREKPYCQSGVRWVAERLAKESGDKYPLAALTGQDSRALTAFLHLVNLYGSSDDHGRHCAVVGMACCVSAMQSSTRHIAKAAIPHVLDWSHEAEIWGLIENAVKNLVDLASAAGGGR